MYVNINNIKYGVYSAKTLTTKRQSDGTTTRGEVQCIVFANGGD